MELCVQQPQKGSYPVPKTLTPGFKLPFENYFVPLRNNYRCEDVVFKQRCRHLIEGHC